MPTQVGEEFIDDVARYARQTQVAFDELRDAAAQLAGVLVLSAAGSQKALPNHPAMLVAKDLHERSMDRILSAIVSHQTAHHHLHLKRAGHLIGRALAACSTVQNATIDVDAALPILKRGWTELRHATQALPGFQTLSFDRACCTEHVVTKPLKYDVREISGRGGLRYG